MNRHRPEGCVHSLGSWWPWEITSLPRMWPGIAQIVITLKGGGKGGERRCVCAAAVCGKGLENYMHLFMATLERQDCVYFCMENVRVLEVWCGFSWCGVCVSIFFLNMKFPE